MNKDNSSLIVGKKIVKVEQLSKRQTRHLRSSSGAAGSPVWLITLDDGTQLLPLRDPEGNGPGVIQVLAEPQITELLWSNTVCM
jgi:hypothetical protein